jgi:hypothetical protein
MNDTEKNQETQVATRPSSGLALDAMDPRELVQQVKLIQQVMESVMKKDEHYGVIPGTGNKPSLLKPGAEKLGFVFRLAPDYKGGITERDLGGGHREYEVICTLLQIHTGISFGQGVGSCSTMEGKYRFRSEVLEGPDGNALQVPKEYWETRNPSMLGGPQFGVRKRDKQWVITHKVEHDNPADYYNTVLKMAKKRAHVDAILTATAASDIFIQDVEDMPEVIPQQENHPRGEGVNKPQPQTAEAPKEATYQGVIEKVWDYEPKKDDKDRRQWFNAKIALGRIWTRKPEVGEMLIEANGLEVKLRLLAGSKSDVFQVLDVQPAPSAEAQASVDNEPDDIPF